MLEYFTRHQRFPKEDYWKDQLDTSDTSSGSHSIRSVAKAARMIETEVKSGSWNEFVKIFAPITSVMMALTLAYGASPADLPIPGGTEFLQQHMMSLLTGGGAGMKGPPNPEEMEKLIEGAAKMSAAKTAEPKNQNKAQRLTQEHLALLVKEGAIKNGMVLPNGMPTVGQKRKAVSSVGPRRKTPIGTQKYPPKAQSVAELRTPKGLVSPVKLPGPTKKTMPASTGPMQTMMTKSGIPIQVARSEVEKAKSGGVLMTKTGVKIQVSKDEVEKANSGKTFTTASGVTIQIAPGSGSADKKQSSPSGTGLVPKESVKAGQAQTLQRTPAKTSAKQPTAANTPQRPTAQSILPKAASTACPQKPPVKKSVPASTTGSTQNTTVPKKAPPSKVPPLTGPPKIQAAKPAPKKLAT